MLYGRINAWLLRRWYSDRPIRVFIPLTGVFILIAAARRWCYRVGLLPVISLPVPVVVVGNISVGGTGKTPFVIWLVQSLRQQGYRPGIITRGYGGASAHWPLRVTPDSEPRLVGDEAVLLATRTRVPVVAGPDRVKAGRQLVAEDKVDVIVSDDGLQHYHLARDFTIIMLEGARGLGNGWRLPAGPLRESALRLREVDLVVSKSDLAQPLKFSEPVTVMNLRLHDAVSLSDGSSRALEEFAGQAVHALAGIGNPLQFFKDLEKHGLQVAGRALPDHANFCAADLQFDDAAPVLMTEKDAIKCRKLHLPHHWYVPASAEFSGLEASRILSTIREKLGPAGTRLAAGN